MMDRATVDQLVRAHRWAILPASLEALTAAVAAGAAVPRGASGRSRRPGRVAVVAVHGVMMQRAGALAELFGAISTEGLTEVFRELGEDDDVGAVVVSVDSPGGEVAGLLEAAAELRALRELKPVVAVANPMAASAAYWLASQATEVLVTPSGEVGGVGVYREHFDLSGAMAEAGVVHSYIYAGKHKVEGNPFEPLDKDARAYAQTEIDTWYSRFVTDVALGRREHPSVVRSSYGEGRMLLAGAAVKAGMADGTATLQSAVSRALAIRSGSPAARSHGFYRARALSRGNTAAEARERPRDASFYHDRARRRRAG